MGNYGSQILHGIIFYGLVQAKWYNLKLILVKTKLPIGEYLLKLCPRACSKENTDDDLTDQSPHKWSSHLASQWTL